MTPFPQEGLGRLAERVVAGEVVFFVGAGFSIDSECNTTQLLIGRLLARFDAMTALLAEGGPTLRVAEAAADCAKKLRRVLTGMFSLNEVAGCLTTPTNVAALEREYYTVNDWLASAFSVLLEKIKEDMEPAGREELLAQLSDTEQVIFCQLIRQMKRKCERLSPPLSRITVGDLMYLLDLPAAEGGKALFLETMGFTDAKVMAGLPCDLDLAKVEQSYGRRLRPRHHVLARLAREGLAPTLLTTNFDLLLEGAYRLAGLSPHVPEGAKPSPIRGVPPATFDAFRRVTSAIEFFGRGDDHRSANLLKIHGCAESYRSACHKKELLEAYLPSLVFTFREIQNWRDDSWSRDLVSTLLRTRTVVFCGYSGADPVLHDTIRTVYEEMARRRGKLGKDRVSRSEEAPAFFLGNRKEFYGMEILRAASRAIGSAPELDKHLNYLHFHFVPDEGEGPFPLLDEVMRWLFHLVFRRRQAQALESNLGRVATVLLGHPCPEAERQAVLKEFEALRDAEEAAAAGWGAEDEVRAHRVCFERVVGWVERFQVPLLRELALGEAVLRSSGPGLELDRLRRSRWYCPALDHADWAAWGAVVELALRRRIAAWQEVKDWKQDQPWIAPAAGSHPAVTYSQGEARPTPACLTVRLRVPGGRVQVAAIRGACRRHHAWDLEYGEIPWRREAKSGTPGAAILWKWAHRPLAEIAQETEGEKFADFF